LLAVLGAGRLTTDRDGRPCFLVGRGLALDERAGLEHELADVDAWLAPIAPEEVGPCVLPLLATMPSEDAGALAAARAAAYLAALEGMPRRAVGEACRRVLRGEAGDKVSPVFAPTPPQLARLAQAIAAPLHFDRHQIAVLLAAGEEAPRPPRAEREATVDQLLGFVERGRRTQEAVDAASAGTPVDRGKAALEREVRIATGLEGRSFPPAPSRAVVALEPKPETP
jgi:hypothetical protein